MAFFSCSLNSGVSLWPWTATACCTAASSSSFSVLAEMAMEQLLSLGNCRQSTYLRSISASYPSGGKGCCQHLEASSRMAESILVPQPGEGQPATQECDAFDHYLPVFAREPLDDMQY